jgi:hypothetical protein
MKHLRAFNETTDPGYHNPQDLKNGDRVIFKYGSHLVVGNSEVDVTGEKATIEIDPSGIIVNFESDLSSVFEDNSYFLMYGDGEDGGFNDGIDCLVKIK